MFLMFLFIPFAAKAVTYTSLANDGYTKFKAIGRPQMIKIIGNGPAAAGTLKIDNQKVEGKFQVDLNVLTTGIALRDQHMKENYLHVKEHPVAKLEVLNTDINLEHLLTEKQSGIFEAELYLHGTTQKVRGRINSEPVDKEGFRITVNWSIQLSDFAIDTPSYLGVKVTEKVDLENVIYMRVIE